MPGGVKKRIALVLTGAVSLGSFEAGVAYELVNYVRQQDNPEFEIDVIVGTSAGALTGALTAIALAYGADPRIIENAWMSVKLEDLLRLNKQDRSVLSSSRVEELIRKHIVSPAGHGSNPYRKPQAVSLVVVVTNLDGIKYEIHRTKDDEFSVNAIGYEDAMRFVLKPGFDDWERLRNAVRASSAFPGAFEHKKIIRAHREFKRLARYNFTDQEHLAFHYSDGGIVNNQPLNKAIEVVNDLPVVDSNDAFERVFLVVDPAPPRAEPAPKEDYGVFDVVSRALWTIPRNQTLYRDLLLLEKTNRRIRWKNSFVTAVAQMWDTGAITPEKAQALNQMCREVALFKGKTMLGMDPEEYLRIEEDRIRSSYSSELRRVNNAELFIKYCFLLEQVADLRNKHEVTVEMITPQNPEKELAGVIFGNFGGFLDTGFMNHDFNVGCTYARRWMNKDHLDRLIHFGEQGIPHGVKRKVVQGILDNSIPLLIEDIGPRLFSGRGDLPSDVMGVLGFVRMFVVGLAKYIVKKSVTWTKEKVLTKQPT